MPVIRISEKTCERMKKYARPLENSPDDGINLARPLSTSAGLCLALARRLISIMYFTLYISSCLRHCLREFLGWLGITARYFLFYC
jgi:hypothetical protein